MGILDFIKKKKEEPVPSAPEMPSPELSGLTMDAPPKPTDALGKSTAPTMEPMPSLEPTFSKPESSEQIMPSMPEMPKASEVPSIPEMPKTLEKPETADMPNMSDSGLPKIHEESEPIPPQISSESEEPPSTLPEGSHIEDTFPEESRIENEKSESEKDAEVESLIPKDEKSEMPPLEPIKPADVEEEPPAKIEDDLKEKVDDSFEKKFNVKHVEPITPLADNYDNTSSISSRIINEALFVNVDVFRNVAQIVNSLGTESKVAEEAILRINDITLNKEKIFDKWQNDLEQIERELIHLDKLLFNL